MKKLIELGVFVLSIAVFIFGLLMSVVYSFFPAWTQENAIFDNSRYIKELFTDKYTVLAFINTYIYGIIPALVFAALFVVLIRFIKKKLPRLFFYLVGFFGCTLSSLALNLRIRALYGFPMHYYPAATIVVTDSQLKSSITATWLSYIFASLLLGALVVLLCWIVELIYNRIKVKL